MIKALKLLSILVVGTVCITAQASDDTHASLKDLEQKMFSFINQQANRLERAGVPLSASVGDFPSVQRLLAMDNDELRDVLNGILAKWQKEKADLTDKVAAYTDKANTESMTEEDTKSMVADQKALLQRTQLITELEGLLASLGASNKQLVKESGQ